MSSGERTGEEASNAVKGVFGGINKIGEEIRHNINGLADGVGDGIAGRSNTTHTGVTGTSGTTHDGIHTGTSGTTGTTGTTTTGSSGFSNDAKLAGAKLDEAVNKRSDGTYSK
nr:hypothetical protein CFP56_54897 [Quercus suber]